MSKFYFRRGQDVSEQLDIVPMQVRQVPVELSALVHAAAQDLAAASALATVFDMFSQLEPRWNGPRAGLASVLRWYAALSNCTAAVSMPTAGPGQGSRFTVRIPLASGPVRPAEVPISDDVPVQVRVLVVDDNQDAAKTLEMALELLDSDAKVAHTAMEALEVARVFRPTVAMLDIGLPDMNGYELARRLRLAPGGSNMKLIATTGWGQEEDRERSVDAGFDHHLTK